MNFSSHDPSIDRKTIDTLLGLFEEPIKGRAFLDDLIRVFHEVGGETVAEIRVHLLNNDLKAITSLAHKMKGISRNMGAVRLGKFCAQLESAAEKMSPAALKDICGLIMQEFDASCAELKAISVQHVS